MKRVVLLLALLCIPSSSFAYLQAPVPPPNPAPAPAPAPVPLPTPPLPPGPPPRALIDGPTLIPSGGSIILDGRRSTFDRGLQWKLLAPHNDDIFLPFDKDGKKDVIMVMLQPPGGTYRFVLIAKSAVLDKGAVVDVLADVDVKEVVVLPVQPAPTPIPTPPGPGPTPPGPGPTPDPGPNPPAPIPPVAGVLHVSYIHSTSLDPSSAAVVRSASIKSALEGLTAKWRVYQSDQDEIVKLHFDKYIQPTDVPCVLIQDASGKVLQKLSNPDEAAITAAISKIRSGK